MWVEVLPAKETEEVYFLDIHDDPDVAWQQLKDMVRGTPRVVYSEKLAEKFGLDPVTGGHNVIMVTASTDVKSKLPTNKKATYYEPNEYGIVVRGDAVLVGWECIEGSYVEYEITSMPAKWKVIHDMETVLSEAEYPGKLRGELEELLLSVTDPDVRKMYEEAREQLDWRTT